MTLEQLRASLREKSAAIPTLREKGLKDETPEQNDFTAYEAAVKELESLERKIDALERDEAVAAKASKPATAPAIASDAPKVEARPLEKMSYGDELSLVAAAVIKAGKEASPESVLEDEGYGSFVKDLLGRQRKVTNKAVNTLVSSEGGVLVPVPLDGGILPLLRAQSTFLNAGPMRVQFVNGQFNQPRGATGATASYVAEGALKPVSTPTFDAIAMRAKKLAGIVPMTNEARKWTVGNIQAYVQDDLRQALALTMDLNAYLGTGAGASPTGILNKSGVQTVTGTFASPTAPTLAEIDTFVNAMILKLTVANLYSNGKWRWIMSYRTIMRLGTLRTGNGELAFPDTQMGGGNPTFAGIPVIVTNQLPTNLGTGTDETLIALVDFSNVLFGEEQGIVIRMSDQASLNVDGAGTMVHLFQQNMFAILAESEHDFGLRYSKAVVKASAIRF